MASQEMAADFTEVLKSLNEMGLRRNSERITKKILRTLGQRGQTQAKKSYRGKVGKRTGELYKSIKYGVNRKGTFGYIGPRGAKQFMKAAVLEKGWTISAKGGGFLRFKIGDKWITKKQVEIKPRDWFFKAVDGWFNSPESRLVLESTLQKEIQKIWEKQK